MGLPTCQSVVTSVSNRYCLMRSESVRASQTLEGGTLMRTVALATSFLSIILKPPVLDQNLYIGKDGNHCRTYILFWQDGRYGSYHSVYAFLKYIDLCD